MASRRKSASSEAEEKPPSMATSAGAGGEADEDDESEEDLDFLTKLSSELQYGYRILRHLTQDQNVVWPFLEPVDVEGLQLNGYHEIIDRPICFKDSKLLSNVLCIALLILFQVRGIRTRFLIHVRWRIIILSLWLPCELRRAAINA